MSGFFPAQLLQSITQAGFFGAKKVIATGQTFTFHLAPPADNSTGPFGTGTSEGWVTSSPTFFPVPLGFPMGATVPAIPFFQGVEMGMVAFIQDGGNTENIFMVGTQAQNFFLSWKFKNRLNNTETYLTSAATFDTVTFPGFSWWHWPAVLNFPYLGLVDVLITMNF